MPLGLSYNQDTFSGGLNLLSLDTAIAPNQYMVGLNLRTRFGYVKPIRSPIEINEGLPSEIRTQGLYAFGSLLIWFGGGLAYYKLSTSDIWNQIIGFSMDPFVDRIYCCAVPEASLRYLRKATTVNPSDPVDLLPTTTITNPISLVVQDGINQPYLIFADGTCRQANTYAAWTTVDREYVPIGKQMAFFNNILFVVDPLGHNIYRSVSGRPLDFVVAVNNTDGDKVADATATSFAVDSNEIKLFTQLNTDSLLVVTAYTAYSVTLDFDDTVYDEPTFQQSFLFSAGVTNQFSFADILGDFAFIDKEGLKSFNAVSQLRFEGNNSVFSLTVAALFKNKVQTDPCVGSFDNYTFFAVKTIYSDNTILVFDNIQKVFISLDIILSRPIRQFASTYTDSQQRFFVATTTSVFELYSDDSETYEPATLFTRAFDTRNANNLQNKTIGAVRTTMFKSIFEEAMELGRVQITEVVDGRIISSPQVRDIDALSYSMPYPVVGPALATVVGYMNNISIPIQGKNGQKVAYILLWTGGSRLTNLQISVDATMPKSSLSQQEKATNN